MKKDKGSMENFWNDYWNADILKRSELIKKTKCFDRMYNVLVSKKVTKKTKEFIFNQMLQSYFDDLLSVLEK